MAAAVPQYIGQLTQAIAQSQACLTNNPNLIAQLGGLPLPGHESLTLDYDALKKVKDPADRVCALYDYPRKSEYLSKGRLNDFR